MQMALCWTNNVRERRKNGRQKGLIGRISILNERTGQFYKVVHCKAVENRNPNGLKT